LKKILFVNSSPNKNGNTYHIGMKILKNIEYETLQMSDYKISQYGQVYDDDQIREVFERIEQADIILIGTPIYWYTVSGLLKTFIDRLYMLPESEKLNGKKLYFFAQGSGPDDGTEKTIIHLVNRLSIFMKIDLKGVIVDSNDGEKIVNNMTIES